MGLKADYEKVMETSADQFKAAYATWFDELKRKVNELNDPQARKTLLEEQMAKSGFEKGKDFTSYLDWKKNLPKVLEAVDKKMATGPSGLVGRKLEQILKDKTAKAAFEEHCKKTLNTDTYIFATTKMKPKDAWDKYLGPKAKFPVDLSTNGKLQKEWQELGQDEASLNKEGASALKQAQEHAWNDLDQDVVSAFNMAQMRTLAKPDLAKEQKLVQTLAMALFRQLTAYEKRWADYKPDFWTGPKTFLNDLVGKAAKW